ncbi:MAG: kelch repeat-containing protein [Candidatus Moranbacteria bacterium]|nr:kelch repeat-containing protein [Candidatus Moranbacteria bacterium]
MGTARIASSSGVIDGKIYVAGGTKDWDDQATMEMYDPENDTWTDKASLSEPRVTPASAVIDGKLYVVGGRDKDWNSMATLEIYNPSSNTWETKASMPTARTGPASAVFDGKLYVIGGSEGKSGDWGESFDTVEVYDPTSNTWETKTPMPTPRGQGVTAQAIGGKIYVAGGGDDYTFTNILEVYDIATDTWETKASMPEARSGLSSAIIDGKMLVIGGTNNDWDPVDDILIYNPETDSWNKLTDLPLSLHRTAAQIVNGDIFIIGGKDTDWNSADDVYKLPTTYLSDAYQKEFYSSINWDSTTPSGTSVELLYSLDSGKTYESLGTEEGTHYLPVNSAYSLRYKAVLSTNNTSITPSLNSVEIKYARESEGLYGTSGLFTSPVLDSGNTSQWGALTEDATKPANTSITYQTRVGDTPTPDDTWEDWKDASDSIASRDARYIQYRATLSTTDQNQTPVLHSLTLNFSNSTYTPVIKIGNHTTLNLDPDNQITLRSPYLVFSGKVENLSTATIVQIFQDGKLLKNVKINKNHRYRFRTKPRKNQTHTYQFKYLNKDKQVLLVSPTYTILIDRLNPKITNLPKTINASPGDTITWSTTDNDQIDHYRLTFRGVKSQSAIAQFTLPENLKKGSHKLIIRTYDRAGNMAKRKVKVRVR